jgi:hypothetical protein
VALFTVLVLSTVRDASSLFSYPVAVGADGYYYVLQINQLLNNGHLYFGSYTPLVFYVLAGLSLLTRNPILAIKLGSVGFNVLLSLGVFALVSSITRNQWLGVLGGAVAALSGMHFYLIAEFIKNLAGVTLLIWAAWCATRAREDYQARWVASSIALILFALLSHISVWGIAPVMFVLLLIVRCLTNAKRSKLLKLTLAFVVVFLIICPALIAFQKFVQLPPWLGSELLIRPRWPISPRSPVGKAEMLALLLTVPTSLFLIVRRGPAADGNTFRLVVGAVALWSLVITLNPFLNHDVTQLGIIGRLDHLMHLQVSIILPALIWLSLPVHRKLAGLLLALTPCFMAASALASLPKGLQSWYLLERQQMIQALPEHRQQLGANPLVIAQHGDEFVVTWVLGIPAQQNVAEFTDNQSAYWLLHQVNPALLTPSMVVVLEEDSGFGLILVKSDELREWLERLDKDKLDRLLTHNPHLKNYVSGAKLLESPG